MTPDTKSPWAKSRSGVVPFAHPRDLLEFHPNLFVVQS